MELEIRAAHPDDSAEIARLSDQLGYPVDPAHVRGHLERFAGGEARAVFVADARGGSLAGWIEVALQHSLTAEPCAMIAGLVVDETRRGTGTGRRLVERAERWARDAGVRLLRVRSRVEREGARAFYEALGYRLAKTQQLFRRKLEEPLPDPPARDRQ